MRTLRVLSVLVVIGLGLLFLDSGALFAQDGTPPAPPPSPVGTTLDALRAKADKNGKVLVIVKLKTTTAFQPESTLSTTEAAAQREAIAQARGALVKTLAADKATVTNQYDFVPYLALALDRTALEHLITSGQVETIQENTIAKASLTAETSLIHADQLWASGYDGDGWMVAILDTGIDEDHPFFGSRINQTKQKCFSNAGGLGTTLFGASSTCNNGSNVQTGTNASNAMSAGCMDGTVTLCEHGTHVAGIAAGNASGVSGAPGNGVAPHAQILPIQVFTKFPIDQCGRFATGPCIGAFSSDYISALDYVYSLRSTYKIAAVNMSLGGGTDETTACDSDSAKTAIDNLKGAQIPTVIAAGNDGVVGISHPACISSAVTVGASDNADGIAWFSNRSSTLLDLFAPGVNVLSSIPNNTWANESGTSMATPMVVGSYAALREAFPSTTTVNANQMLAALKTSSVGINVSGTYIPRIDLASALNKLNGVNNPPRTPSSPTPTNLQGGIGSSTSLSWVGGDPENDTVTYAVKLDTVNPPATVKCSSSSSLSCATGTLTGSTTYYWQVVATDSHSNVTNGPVWSFNTTTAAPTNDNIANAIVITGTSYGNIQDNTGATVAGTDQNLTCALFFGPQNQTVWYKFTPSANGVINVNTADSNFPSTHPFEDTIIGVWTGNTPGSQTLVGCNDDGPLDFTSSIDALNVTAGTTYYIEFAGASTNDFGALHVHFGYTVANALPNTPSNPSPANGVSGASLNPTLTWTGGDPDAGDTVRYDVYFGKTNPPTTLLCSNVTAASCPVSSALTDGTTYRWTVVATDNHAGTVTGPTWSFVPNNHPPAAPSAPSPADNATDVSKTVTLTWTDTDPDEGDTIKYDVFLDTNATPTTKVCSAISVASCSPAGLTGSTVYHWKVVATDSHGASMSTPPVWTFTTANTPPNTPSAPSPTDAATGVSLNPTLTWTGGDADPGDPVTYDVYFDTVNPPVTLLAECTALSMASCTPSTVLTDTTVYYWKVVATDSHAASVDGPVWSFTALNHEPNDPSNPSPTNGAPEVSLTPTLTWTGGDPDQNDTVTYKVYLAAAANATDDPATLVGTCNDISAASCTPSGVLTDHQLYTWKVVATDNHGVSHDGDIWSFTAVNHPPAAPSSPTPADNATQVSLTPSLSWSDSDPDQGDSVAGYDVYLDTSNPPTTLICTGVATAACTPSSALLAGTVYHWQVVSTDTHGASTTGPVWTFTTRNDPPNVPSSPSPATLATSTGVTPSLTWAGGDPNAGDVVTYTVYLDTKSKPVAVACSGITTEVCSFPGSLAFNTKYYWKVVATDNHGATVTGPVWSFTTAFGPPALTAPKNNATTSVQLTKFSWKAIKGETTYHLTITGDASGVVFDQDVSAPKGTWTSPTPLPFDHYTWHVSGAAPVVTAPTLDWSFDLTLGKTPARGTLAATHLPKFTWTAVKGATAYDLEVFANDPACVTAPVFSLTDFAKPSYAMLVTDPQLEFGSYSWHVKASQGTVTTSYGPCVPFILSSLKAPKPGGTSSVLTPKFSWGANKAATGYQITVSQHPADNSGDVVKIDKPVPTAAYAALPTDLLDFGTYLWHITEGPGGFTQPTPDAGFTISLAVKPLPGTFSVDNTPTFSWKKATDATSYTLQIALASDPTFTSPVRTYTGITKLTYTVPITDGLPQGTYLWRIVTVGGPGHTMPGWTIVVGP